jgi:hypothetical protein
MNDPADPRPRSIDNDLDYFRNRFHPTQSRSKGHSMRTRWDPGPLSGWRSTAQDQTQLRVSDAERNAVADKLSQHFAEGRLDQTEFKERLDRAMSAKTEGDLRGLFDDLPRLADAPPPPPSRRRRVVPFVLMLALISLAAGSTLTFTHMLFMPWWLFVLAGLFLWNRFGGRHHTHHRLEH